MNRRQLDVCTYGLLGLLTIAFVVLKLGGAIAWSWWWVLLPTLVLPVVFLLVVFIAVVATVIKVCSLK